MVLTIICGSTGTGKTQRVRELITPFPNLCVYDRQGHDYPEYEVFNGTRNQKKFRMIGRRSIETIKKMFDPETGVKGFAVVIEEATGIFDGTVGKEWIDIALSKRHRQNRFFFIFHAIHRVPPDLMEYADYVYLFKTGDFDKNVKSKFPDMFNDFMLLNNNEVVPDEIKTHKGKEVKTKEYFPLRSLNNGGTISEHVLFRRTDLSKENFL